MKSKKQYEKDIATFFYKQNRFKQIQEKFETTKQQFYDDMEYYFDKYHKDESKVNVVLDDGLSEQMLAINKIVKVKINFDVDKLEKRLDTELRQEIINKKVEIINLEGLIEYLKQCGVNPKEFKKYINVRKEVNTKKLDRMEELGRISLEDIEGCYSIDKNSSTVYFKVALRKGDND